MLANVGDSEIVIAKNDFAKSEPEASHYSSQLQSRRWFMVWEWFGTSLPTTSVHNPIFGRLSYLHFLTPHSTPITT